MNMFQLLLLFSGLVTISEGFDKLEKERAIYDNDELEEFIEKSPQNMENNELSHVETRNQNRYVYFEDPRFLQRKGLFGSKKVAASPDRTQRPRTPPRAPTPPRPNQGPGAPNPQWNAPRQNNQWNNPIHRANRPANNNQGSINGAFGRGNSHQPAWGGNNNNQNNNNNNNNQGGLFGQRGGGRLG